MLPFLWKHYLFFFERKFKANSTSYTTGLLKKSASFTFFLDKKSNKKIKPILKQE